MPVPVLSQSDVATLREIVKHYRSLVQQGLGSRPAEQDLQASDAYIARAPAGGIPALTIEGYTGTGTGMGGEVILPGYAECDIYQVSYLNDVPELSPIAGFTKVVYNLSTSAIAADVFLKISKDKMGSWLADTGGSGGGCDTVLSFITGICRADEVTTGTG